MPVRNGAAYVAEAVGSVLEQTLEDVEVIVIDDGSSDGTREVLQAIVDDRLTVIAGEPRGISASLNIGLSVARGELIARQDADDQSMPTRLAEQEAFLRDHPDHVLVGTDATVVSDDGVELYRARMLTDPRDVSAALDRLSSPFFHGSVMFRKAAVSAVGGYDEAVPYYVEDIVLWLRLRALGPMTNIPQALYRYTLAASSVSRLPPAAAQARRQLLERVQSGGVVTASDFARLVRATASPRTRRAAYELEVGKALLDYRGDRAAARSRFGRSIAAEPWRARPWFNLALSAAPKPVLGRVVERRNLRANVKCFEAP